MADVISARNCSDDVVDVPAKYFGGASHTLAPGGVLLINDTLPNVWTAFGQLPSNLLELRIVVNGAASAGVITPSGNSYISPEQVSTGAQKTLSHGLGVTPSRVSVVPSDKKSYTSGGRFAVTEGAHDGTNLLVTVSAGRRFRVVAS